MRDLFFRGVDFDGCTRTDLFEIGSELSMVGYFKLEQYSGKTDKKNNYITEGDIVRVDSSFSESIKKNFLVVFDKHRGSFALKSDSSIETLDLYKFIEYGNKCEIIGKFNYNPELQS